MKLNWLLTISAVYLALVGFGLLFAPSATLFGTVPSDAPAALIANLRGGAGTFLGIAVFNWMVRNNAEASSIRNAIVLANTVGFGLAGILGVLAVVGGAPTIQLVPTVINLLIAIVFLWAGCARMPVGKS